MRFPMDPAGPINLGFTAIMSKSKREPTRRQVLTGMGAALGAAALGCGGTSPGAGEADAAGPDGLPDAAPPDVDPLAHCKAPSDLGPAELLAHIDTFVVLCMENRSFDHYLGALALHEGRADIKGLIGTESNPGSNGEPVPVHLLENFTPADPPHDWEACHAQWNSGANDGFVLAHAGASEADVMGYHVREQIPAIYALADQSAVCNHWYSSLLGPTWPNRFYLHGATSNGRQSNAPVTGFRSIFEVLTEAGISNTNFYHDVAWALGGYFKSSGLAGIETFFTQAATGTLPQVSIIDPHFFGAGANDDHPDHDVRLGQVLIGSIYNALVLSPQWERCMFIVTYDEHGGFHDHVAPPLTQDERVEFRQLGFRVPSLVAGPTVRRGCAIDTTFEHTSVIATLTRRFGLDNMNDRVAVTYDLSRCIDPELIDAPKPGIEIPPLDISLSALRQRPSSRAHSELAAVLDAHSFPRHLDRRDRAWDVTRQWLRHAEQVGAARVKE
jgi:phospholipase C